MRMANSVDADQTAPREKKKKKKKTGGVHITELVKIDRSWLRLSGKYQKNRESYRINTPW